MRKNTSVPFSKQSPGKIPRFRPKIRLFAPIQTETKPKQAPNLNSARPCRPQDKPRRHPAAAPANALECFLAY
jgi:hypothetical protein